jgi:hypothetical protein
VSDANGNAIVGDNVTLAIGFNANGSTLAVAANPVATDALGMATFTGVSLDKAGVGYTLTVTDSNALSATSNTFNIVASAATSIVFTTQPTDAAAGVSIAPAIVVHVHDGDGNAVPGDNVTLTIANNPGTSTLSGGGPVATDAFGDATFTGVSLNKVGVGYTLTATDSGATPLTTTSSPFNITPAAAAALSFSVQPSNTIAGVAISPAVTVSLVDAFGNVETGDSTDHVTLALASGIDPTFTGGGPISLVGGVATFPGITLTVAGSYMLGATTDAGAFTATSVAFTVSPAAADHVEFTTQPSDTVAGATITPAVVLTEFDQYENIETGDSTTHISLTANGPGGLSGAPLGTFTNGVKTYSNLMLATAGTYTLDANAGSFVAISNQFVVSSGSGEQLAFVEQPVNVVQGGRETVQVAIEDAGNNVVTSDNSTVIALTAPVCGGVTIGTATVANGVATFDLQFYTQATLNLTASSTSATSATSFQFSVTPNPDLVFADGFEGCRP